jgi:hypothetical protein
MVRWPGVGNLAAEHFRQESKGSDQQAEKETEGAEASEFGWCCASEG